MWYFLIGFIPFINPLRAFPLPSFWQDASTFMLLMAWVVFASPRKIIVSKFSLNLNWATLILGLVIIFILIQQLMEMTLSSHYSLLAIFVLLGGALVHVTARDLARGNASLEEILVPWSCGLVFALLINFAAAHLARNEMEWALFRFVSSTPLPRDGGFFGQPNQYGVFCLLALTAWSYLYSKGRMRASVYHGINVVGFFAVAMSGSRAAIVVWVGISVVEYWLNARKDSLKFRHWKIRQFIFVFCQVAYILLLKFDATRDASPSMLRSDTGPRVEQWRDALILILEHPFLGVGFGNFAAARFFELKGSMLEPQSTHTHNIFSHLLVEFGLGSVFVLILMVFLIGKTYSDRVGASGKSDEAILLGGVCLGLFIYSNFEYPLWYVSFLYTFLFLFGLAVGYRCRVENERAAPAMIILRRVGAMFMLTVGLFAAYDYWKIQSNLLQTIEALEGRPTRDIRVSDVMLIRLNTLFVDQLDELWIDISDPRDGAAYVKFPIVERLFAKTPSVGGAVQYIYYALAVGDEKKAAFVLRRFATSNPIMGQRLRSYLNENAKRDFALAKFLERYDLADKNLPQPHRSMKAQGVLLDK